MTRFSRRVLLISSLLWACWGGAEISRAQIASLAFDGNAYVEVPAGSLSPDLDQATTALTLNAWIYLPAAPGGYVSIVARRNFAGGERTHFHFNVTKTLALSFETNYNNESTGRLVTESGPNIVPVGRWTMVSVSFDQGLVRMSVDGVLQFENDQTLVQELVPNGHWLNIGAVHRSGGTAFFDYFTGNIRDVAIWKRAVSVDDLARLREGGASWSALEAGLVGRWALDEGTGTQVLDAVTQATGVVYGAQWAELGCSTSGSLLGQYTLATSARSEIVTPALSAETSFQLRVCGTIGYSASNLVDPAYRVRGEDGTLLSPSVAGGGWWLWNSAVPRRPDTDEPRSDHSYVYSFDGTGAPETLLFEDGAYGDNSGALQVDLVEAPPAQDLVADYPLDGDAQDASGNAHHGTLVGTSPTVDRFGQQAGALRFSAGDRVDIGDSIQLGSPGDSYTLSFWVQSFGTGSNMTILSDYDGSFTGGDDSAFAAWLSAEPDGSAVFSVRPPGDIVTSRSIVDGLWHHVAGRVDGAGGMTLYVDGTSVGSTSYNASANRLVNPFWRLGTHRWGDSTTYQYPFEGSLDEFRIYGRALSEAEIEAIASDFPLSEGLEAHYIFGGDATDASNNGWDGAVVGANPTVDRFGNPNSAFEFNAAGDVIQTSYPGVTGSSPRTISAWVRTTSSDGNKPVLYYGAGAGNGGDFQVGFNRNHPNETIIRGVKIDGGHVQVVYQENVADAEWHHYVWVVPELGSPSFADIQIFQDGQRLSNALFHWNGEGNSQSTLVDTGTGNPMVIHPNVDNPDPTGGLAIDDLRVYSRALDVTDISALYLMEGGLAPTGPNAPANLAAVAGNGSITLEWTASTGPNLASYKVFRGTAQSPTTLLASVGPGTVSYSDTGLTNGKIYHYRITAIDDSGTSSAYSNEVASAAVGLVGFYTFSGNPHDDSGAANHGAVYGASLATDRFGRSNSAYSFDGDDYIVIPSSDQSRLTGPFTVSAWVNVATFATGQNIEQHPILSKINSDGWSGGYELMAVGEGGNYYSLASRVGGSNAWGWSAPPSFAGGWDHVVGVYDGAGLRVYRNGIGNELDTAVRTGGIEATGLDLVLGKRSGGGNYWYQGSIDDVRLYNLALTPGEIVSLYESERPAELAATAVCHDFESGALADFHVAGAPAAISTIAYQGSYAIGLQHTGGTFHDVYPAGLMAGYGTYSFWGRTLDSIADLAFSLFGADGEFAAPGSLTFNLRPTGSDNPGANVGLEGTTELASSSNAGFAVNEWARFEIEVSPGIATVRVNGVEVLSASGVPDLTPGRFRIGAVSSGLFDVLCYQAAQVTVASADVAASVGEEVSVPVILSGVEGGTSVSAFQFTVTPSDPNLVFLGHETAGTLASSFTVASNPSNGNVGGFVSSSGALTESGTLVLLRLRADAEVTTTVNLVGFSLNGGDVAHAPATPSFAFSTGSAGPSSDFRLALQASNGSASVPLDFGVTAGATNGFDVGVDMPAPPPPPLGAFDARLRNGTEDYTRDIRGPGEQSYQWTLPWQSSTPLTLSWNQSELPPDGRMILSDVVGGILFSVNMADASSAEIPALVNPLLITYSKIDEVEVDLAAGWNMVGLPFEEPTALADSYPGALAGSFFAFEGAYISPDPAELVSGHGYWLRFAETQSITHSGIAASSIDVVLNTGWNMVSGPNCTLPVGAIGDPSGILLQGTVFGFNGAYTLASEIVAGAAYWLRASEAGTITLDCSAAAKNAAASERIASFFGIELEDASGAAQRVFLGGTLPGETSDLAYTAPPRGPGSTFSVAFEDGRYLSEAIKATVAITGASFPITVTSENSVTIQALSGGELISTHNAPSGQVMEIVDPRVNQLRLSAGGDSDLPEAFVLEQNYPNPFNPVTTIRFGLPEPGPVTLEVFDALGRRVMHLLRAEERKAGWHAVPFDARHLTSGTYFYRIQAGVNHRVRRMVLLR